MSGSCAALAAPALNPPTTLGRRASLVVAALVVAHTLWTSAAPAIAYRLYAQQWHLSHMVTTEIFAIYPLAVVTALVLFGGLSDQIGRRAVMLLGLSASLTGALLFALAPNVTWLFLARAAMGLGVGLAAGPSTAAVADFSLPGPGTARHAALVTTLAQAGGFAAALLLGGALAQYAPWPTRLTFWVLVVLLSALLIAAWFLPHDAPVATAWRPRLPQIPAASRLAFVAAALAMMTAYTHGVLILSLGGQVAHDLIGSSNQLINGAVLAIFALTSGVFTIVGRALPVRLAMALGALASAAGMGLMALAVARHELPIFLLATTTAGAGYSLLFLSALEVIGRTTKTDGRVGVLSAIYLLAYLSLGGSALVLGIVATAYGLASAVNLGTAAIFALSLCTLVVAKALRTNHV